jgi:hypothetical protein
LRPGCSWPLDSLEVFSRLPASSSAATEESRRCLRPRRVEAMSGYQPGECSVASGITRNRISPHKQPPSRTVSIAHCSAPQTCLGGAMIDISVILKLAPIGWNQRNPLHSHVPTLTEVADLIAANGHGTGDRLLFTSGFRTISEPRKDRQRNYFLEVARTQVKCVTFAGTGALHSKFVSEPTSCQI